MYPVSESYKNALLQSVINDTVTGTVTLKDKTVIELTDEAIVKGSLRISHELCRDYRIGTFSLGCLKIGFFDDNALLRNFSGAEIKLSYGIETEEGSESVPLGIFIVDGSTVKRKRSTITLTAYDYGILFDCEISESIRAMNATAEELITAVCDSCGVEYGGMDEGLPNTAVSVSPSSCQIQSCRDLVEWCAAMVCGYGVIDREGKLKIISARYKVSAEDSSEIIIDKYLKSFERNNIYVTDTRSWIASLSAYSGDERKIYKSTITQSDQQAARAVYSLDKNPLLEDKSESECDIINSDWLSFVDGFKQRGISAEIYGDPSLDVGDVLRCSEGDIDQRRSIVGLVTSQEWRYRSFHTINCACAQLSDGFPEEEETEDEEAEAEETEALSAAPVKVISQLEKRIDNSGGEEYSAGQGLYLNGNQFNLKRATSGEIGGVGVSVSTETGIYLLDTIVTLRKATKSWHGGFKLGDGLVPELTDEYGHSGFVKVRLGEGLEYLDNPETTDAKEIKENSLGGRRIKLAPATADTLGGIKIGEGLSIDSEGVVTAAGRQYTAGDGISISSGNEISVKTGEGLTIDEDGAVALDESERPVVVIAESDTANLLHTYTQVDYISGYKIGYAGPGNQIIVNGYIFENDTTLDTSGSAMYSAGEFLKAGVSPATMTEGYGISMNIVSSTASSTTIKWTDTVTSNQLKSVTTYDVSRSGINFYWSSIVAPTEEYPYGYVGGSAALIYVNSSGNLVKISAATRYFAFASEAEYNAAVGLTYEPQTLKSVSETVTEA